MSTGNMSFPVGRAKVTAVYELDTPPYPFGMLFLGYDEAKYQAKAHLLPPGYPPEGEFIMRVQNWLIEIDGRKVMIDTGFGNDKSYPGAPPEFNNLQTPFLQNLADAGARPEDVDMVICTHLHIDHVGWNARWNGQAWVPTFPNARYIFTTIEREFWDPSSPTYAPRGWEIAQGVFEQGVQPIIDAGLAETVEPDARIDEFFSLVPTPGHTPGQVAVRFECDGQAAIFCGDAIHHPIQILFPDWSVAFDEDSIMSAQSRRRLLSMIADENLILTPAHFAHQACRVERRGDEYVPINVEVEPA